MQEQQQNLWHLFTYDSCYGTFRGEVEAKDEDTLVVNSKEIKILRYNDPEELPWKRLKLIVIESTGLFTQRKGRKTY